MFTLPIQTIGYLHPHQTNVMPIPRNEGGIPLMMAGGVIGSAIGHGDFSVSLRNDVVMGALADWQR
tara:strand:- start:14485 stop:14682 length:198 start_codon:yes stop_codon:yes gene_type:complete